MTDHTGIPREISGQVAPLDAATRIVATPTRRGLELTFPDLLAGATITLDVAATDALIHAAGEAWEMMTEGPRDE